MRAAFATVALLCAILVVCPGPASNAADGPGAAPANAPTLSIAGVRTDPSAGTVTLTGLSAEAPGVMKITVGTLALPLKAAAGPNAKTPPAEPAHPAPTGSVSADDIAIGVGATAIRIKHIDLHGTTLDKDDILALLGSGDPKALEAQLHKLDAQSLALADISIDTVTPAHEEHVSQGRLLFANVVRGKAAVGNGSRATFRIRESSVDTMGEVGAIMLKGLDLGQIAHVLAASRTTGEEPLAPLCDEIEASAVRIAADAKGPPLTIAKLTERGLAGRPLAHGPAAGDAGALLDDLAASVTLDLVEADDLAFASAQGESSLGPKAFGLGRIALRTIAGGRIGHIDLARLGLEGNEHQPGKLLVASASIDNLVARPKPPDGNATGAAMPTLDRIDLRDVGFDFTSPAGEGSDRHIAFSLAHAGYDAPGLEIGKLPAKASLSIDHVVFDVPPQSQAAPFFLAMGYRQIDASSESLSTYDATRQVLTLDKFSVSGAGMGSLDLKLGLDNVSTGIVSQDDKVQQASALAMVFKNADLTFRNEGIVEKAIAFKAAIDGVTPVQERDSLISAARSLPASLGDPSKLQPVAEALVEFLSDPKTLHLSLRSRTGLGAVDIAQAIDAGAILEKLTIDAGANRTVAPTNQGDASAAPPPAVPLSR